MPVEATDAVSSRGDQRDRAVLLNARAAILAKVVTASASLMSFSVAAHSLRPEELGVVAVLATIGMYTSMGDFGLGMQLQTLLPAAKVRGDVEEMRRIIAVTLGTLTLVGSVAAVVGTIAAWMLPWPMLLGAEEVAPTEVRTAVMVFFICAGIAIPATVIGRVLVAMLRSSMLQTWSAAGGVLTVVLVLACAATGAPTWAYVAAINGAPLVIVALTQTVFVFARVLPELRPRSLRLTKRDAMSLLRSSAPYALINVSTFVAFSVDSAVVSAVMGAGAAAVFALAARMFTLVGSTLILAGQQMWSALADAISWGDNGWVRVRFKQTTAIFTGLNALGCLVLVLVGQEISRVWVGPELVPPRSLLIALMVMTVYSTSMLQASYLVIVMGKLRPLAVASAVLAPVNLAVSIVLTRHLGLIGPSLGSIIAICVTTAIPVVRETRRYFATVETPAPV